MATNALAQGGTWEKKQQMLSSRYGASAAVVDNKIYVIGGLKSSGAKALKTVQVYDPETGLRSWEGIDRSESMIVLETLKENGVIEPEVK